MQPLADRIDALARTRPRETAFFSDSEDLTWAEYARRSDRFAAHLAGLGMADGERVAVLLPDGPGVHVAFVGCEKAGLVVMGIGPRAGRDEIGHLVARSGASALVTRPASREHDFRALFEALRSGGGPLRHHVVV
jgi:acyl-CoA synthetase